MTKEHVAKVTFVLFYFKKKKKEKKKSNRVSKIFGFLSFFALKLFLVVIEVLLERERIAVILSLAVKLTDFYLREVVNILHTENFSSA